MPDDCSDSGGLGSVTSVGTGKGLTGEPITTTGTIDFDYSATQAANRALAAGESDHHPNPPQPEAGLPRA